MSLTINKTIRRIFCLVTAIIITVSFFPCSNQSYASDDLGYVKVGLAFGTTASSSASISSDSQLAVFKVISDSGMTFDSSLMTKNVKLSVSGSSVSVKDGSGNELKSLKGDGSFCIAAEDCLENNIPVYYGSSGYRGGIIPYINSNGNLNIINYIDIENYVAGVVHNEIGQSSAAETLKAQAVCARSYAYLNRTKHKSQGFGVCASTDCQVYKGISSEYPSVISAVKATEGEMIYHNGSPVIAYYSANSGGYTENSEDVWSASLGYLRSVRDPYSPEYNWSRTISRADITSYINLKKSIGTVQSITIDSVNPSGYVASLTATGERGTYTLTKDSIRSFFGSSCSLPSRRFSMTAKGGTVSGKGDSGTVKEPENPQPALSDYYVKGSGTKGRLGEKVAVLSASGKSTVSLNGLVIKGVSGNTAASYSNVQTPVSQESSTGSSSGSGTGDGSFEPANSGLKVTFNSDSDVLIINGTGNGHGVGMSQTGAQEMGKKGFNYKDILSFYYTDIEVR